MRGSNPDFLRAKNRALYAGSVRQRRHLLLLIRTLAVAAGRCRVATPILAITSAERVVWRPAAWWAMLCEIGIQARYLRGGIASKNRFRPDHILRS